MQITEESQCFSFNFLIGFTTPQRCIKQLDSNCIEPQAISQEPTQLLAWQRNAFSTHLRHKRSKAGAKGADSLASVSFEVLVKLASKFTFSIEDGPSHALFKSLHEFADAKPRVCFFKDHLFAR